MRVCNICSSDWANFAHQFSESLRSVGVESESLCLNPHPFNYTKQSKVVTSAEIRERTRLADFVILHHSCVELIPLINNNKVIHYAAGTKYRQEYETINKLKFLATFIALPEFQTLTDNFHYIVGSVDTEFLGQIKKPFDNYPIFAHYPSNPGVKGTNQINEIMRECGVTYLTSNERVNYDEQIKRMAECDIYIELLAPTQGGKPYGSFGMTALEAAAMRKIVITQNLSSNDLYYKTYGGCPMELVSDADGLRKTVKLLSNRTFEYYEGMKELTYKWVCDNHSYKATGERVKKILDGL